MAETDLSKYNNSWFKPGNPIKRLCWYIVNAFVFNSYLFPFSGYKRILLRLFGARVGKGVVIKPKVNIKYPWKLEIGDYTWMGEGVWVDNLDEVKIGSNVCLSQGAMLLCGNHNFSKTTFDLMIGKIVLEDGVWIGAKALVGPGVTCKSHSVLSAYSFTSSDLEPYSIYSGNPAQKIKDRKIE